MPPAGKGPRGPKAPLHPINQLGAAILPVFAGTARMGRWLAQRAIRWGNSSAAWGGGPPKVAEGHLEQTHRW